MHSRYRAGSITGHDSAVDNTRDSNFHHGLNRSTYTGIARCLDSGITEKDNQYTSNQVANDCLPTIAVSIGQYQDIAPYFRDHEDRWLDTDRVGDCNRD